MCRNPVSSTTSILLIHNLLNGTGSLRSVDSVYDASVLKLTYFQLRDLPFSGAMVGITQAFHQLDKNKQIRGCMFLTTRRSRVSTVKNYTAWELQENK